LGCNKDSTEIPSLVLHTKSVFLGIKDGSYFFTRAGFILQFSVHHKVEKKGFLGASSAGS